MTGLQASEYPRLSVPLADDSPLGFLLGPVPGPHDVPSACANAPGTSHRANSRATESNPLASSSCNGCCHKSLRSAPVVVEEAWPYRDKHPIVWPTALPQTERKTWRTSHGCYTVAMQSISMSNGPAQPGTVWK